MSRSKDPDFRQQKRKQEKKDRRPSSRVKQGNKGNSSKNQRRLEESMNDDAAVYRSKSNPYAWYAAFPNFARDVATLAFGTPVGQPIYVNDDDYVANAGILTIQFMPTPGRSDDLTSPINRQATRFQSYLRSVQRAAANYDSADTMMYLLAIDSLYTFWAFLRRAYGVAQLFSPTNKYYPRRILQAMNLDPDDIIFNLADFRAYINRFALNIGRFSMPKNFDITQRHMWMCSGLYLDSNTTRAQTYMFVPHAFWQMDNTVTTGSELMAVALDSYASTPSSLTVEELMTLGQQLIQNIDNDDDTMNISGDLLRAYGQSNLMVAEETPDNYAVLPIYDETVLSQIENATICGTLRNQLSATGGAFPNIRQNPSVNNGAILFQPYCAAGSLLIGNSYWRNFALTNQKGIINAHVDNPSPEWVMEATRLMCASTGRIAVAEAQNASLDYFGTDIPISMRICVTSLSNPAAVQFLFTTTNTLWQDEDNTVEETQNQLQLCALLQQFDWAPMLYIYSTKSGLLMMAADVDNMTSVTKEQLGNIHEAALLSVLDVPQGFQSQG